jgi:plasmid stabilization system protein ParE
MSRFTLSPQAAHDIRTIWAYIARDNIRAAKRVRLRISAACTNIAKHPRMGHRREDLTSKPVLFWLVDSYLIVYNPESRPIEIIRVLYAALDIPEILTAT